MRKDVLTEIRTKRGIKKTSRMAIIDYTKAGESNETDAILIPFGFNIERS